MDMTTVDHITAMLEVLNSPIHLRLRSLALSFDVPAPEGSEPDDEDDEASSESRDPISEELSASLLHSISECTGLQSIVLIGIPLHRKNGKQLGSVLSKLTHLRCILIRNLEPDFAALLSFHCPALEELNAGVSNLSMSGLVPSHPRLRALAFECYPFEVIAAMAGLQSLTALSVYASVEAQASAFLSMVLFHPTLVHFTVRSDSLVSLEYDQTALLTGVIQNNRTLQSLHCAIPLPSEDGGTSQLLWTAVDRNRALTSLTLQSTWADGSDAVHLLNALAESNTLTNCDFDYVYDESNRPRHSHALLQSAERMLECNRSLFNFRFIRPFNSGGNDVSSVVAAMAVNTNMYWVCSERWLESKFVNRAILTRRARWMQLSPMLAFVRANQHSSVRLSAIPLLSTIAKFADFEHTAHPFFESAGPITLLADKDVGRFIDTRFGRSLIVPAAASTSTSSVDTLGFYSAVRLHRIDHGIDHTLRE